MCIEGQRGRVLRSDNRKKWSKNGERKSLESNRVASTKECEGCAEVFRVSKLLQIVCQRFCKNSEAVI